MSYDINLISLFQKEPVYLPELKTIKVINEHDSNENVFRRYQHIWPFFSKMPGILYTVVSEDEKMDSWEWTTAIVDDEDDTYWNNIDKSIVPFWVTDKEDIYELTIFAIKEKYLHEFEQVISALIDTSPVGMLMFQSRYQGREKEVICGVFDYSQFVEMLENKKILFNVCYIIQKDGLSKEHTF